MGSYCPCAARFTQARAEQQTQLSELAAQLAGGAGEIATLRRQLAEKQQLLLETAAERDAAAVQIHAALSSAVAAEENALSAAAALAEVRASPCSRFMTTCACYANLNSYVHRSPQILVLARAHVLCLRLCA